MSVAVFDSSDDARSLSSVQDAKPELTPGREDAAFDRQIAAIAIHYAVNG